MLYSVRKGLLRPEVAGKFVDLVGDSASMVAFKDRCKDIRALRLWQTDLLGTMLPLLSRQDRQALMGTNRMLALDRENAALLLGRVESLLDVGAGSGETTRELKSIVEGRVVATEASAFCWARLRQQTEARFTDVLDFHDDSFDVAALLNVLDRAKNPSALLKNAARIATRLLVSICHPLDPFVQPQLFSPTTTDNNNNTYEKNEEHHKNFLTSIRRETTLLDHGDVEAFSSFEDFLNVASDHLLREAPLSSFTLDAIARAPYLCFCGLDEDGLPHFTSLDQGLFLLSRRTT